MSAPGRFVADFHIHSHFSMATSGQLEPEHLDLWARIKGIGVVGTGDFTHPGWVAELREKLEPVEPGLLALKPELRLPGAPAAAEPARFVLTAEISTIYSRQGRTRKVHHVLFAPDFEAVERVQQALARVGSITSDGRPILGIDSRDLLEIALEASPDVYFVPAHIWTPWFSALGAQSGFDSIEDCYRDLAPHISAVETGLSSDPPMNWACTSLDRYTLISNSDAHSPEKLGREANLLACDLSYAAIVDALRTGDPRRFRGTIEFFPEEGKYHYDGHRKCGVCVDPVEALRLGGRCPKCGKPLTAGVASRVAALADRDDVSQRPRRAPFTCVVPLKELLAEIAGAGAGSRQVAGAYERLVHAAGSELGLLLDADLADVERWGGAVLREAVQRVRERRLDIDEGHDGEYGRIRVFGDGEAGELGGSLFAEAAGEGSARAPRPLISFDLGALRRLRGVRRSTESARSAAAQPQPAAPALLAADPLDGLDPRQREAASHGEGPALILAGPGTGKTQTLARRVARLLDSGVPPDEILVLTFTNKAAAELRERLAAAVQAMTFHAYGLSLLRQWPEAAGRTPGFRVLDEQEAAELRPQEPGYRERLAAANAFDFDALVSEAAAVLGSDPKRLEQARAAARWILVDEYQDVNAAQYDLLRLLAPDSRSNLCVIGDPDQAIYGFRGADVAFIRRFTDDYPGAAVYRLERSYRCSSRILRASGQVIGNLSFLEGTSDGVNVRIVSTPTDSSEAAFVAATISRMMGGVGFLGAGEAEQGIRSFADFAVLCRLGRQMDAFEAAFQQQAIPYQRLGEEPFFRQEPARSLLASLRLRRGGAAALLAEAAAAGGLSAEEPALRDLLALAARCGDDPSALLDLAALGTSADAWGIRREQVALMTLHAAKGLEFPCVFLTGCEDGLLPYRLFEGSAADEEEERRLFYVGMTRAERHLFLTHARRSLFGREWRLPRSPFVARIERKLLDEETAAPLRRGPADRSLQLELF